jgi:cell shape-determining protein MreC
MSAIRFNHVFAVLLVLAAVGAFAVPERYTTRAQPQVQGLFMPVASPVRGVSAWAHARLAKPESKDVRDLRTLAAENDELRQENATLQHKLEDLIRINSDRAELGGNLRDDCTPFKVVGGDAGVRQSLLIRGSSLDGLRDGMFVLHTDNVVGLITRPPGLLGAQVRLITDRGVRVTGYFRKLEKGPDGKTRTRRLDTPSVVVEGTGDGAMRCLGLTVEQLNDAGVKPGDWVVVEDKDWDDRIHGKRLGKVAGITPLITAPLYAEVRVEPTQNLMRLREVMVLTK